MKLLVTDNLVSDLSQLDSFNINFEKISIKDIPNQAQSLFCLLYTSPSPRDRQKSRMPSSA